MILGISLKMQQWNGKIYLQLSWDLAQTHISGTTLWKEMGHHIWWLQNNVGIHGGHWLEWGMLEHFYCR